MPDTWLAWAHASSSEALWAIPPGQALDKWGFTWLFCNSTLSLSLPVKQLGSGVSLMVDSSLSISPKWLECGPFLLIWGTLLICLHGCWWIVSTLLCHLFPFLLLCMRAVRKFMLQAALSKWGENASLPFLETSIFRCHSILSSHIYKHLALRVDFLLLFRRSPLTVLIVKTPFSSSQEVSFYT